MNNENIEELQIHLLRHIDALCTTPIPTSKTYNDLCMGIMLIIKLDEMKGE